MCTSRLRTLLVINDYLGRFSYMFAMGKEWLIFTMKFVEIECKESKEMLDVVFVGLIA